MSHFALPVSLCKRMQSAVTRFFWDNNENARKMVWVSWSSMSKPKSIGRLGLRDFQTFNIALLAKISWRLYQNLNCLLSKVLMGKYFPDSNILLAKESSVMSHGWRSVLLGRDLLVQKLGWVVGNGQSISVWNDPWLSTVMQERPMVPPGEQVQELKVAELMLPESCEWDVHKLHLHVPEDQIQCIKPSQSGSLDKVICLGTKTGEYSTKSGYYFAVNMEDIRDEMANAANLNVNFNWKKHIWDLDIAPKVRMFSWKLLKGAIPVGERLAERHVPIEPRCKWCGCSESILHLLFHCPFARKVWSLAPFTTMMECSGMIDLAVSWPVLCDKQCLPPSGVTSTTLAPWILWNLWKARNKFTFEGHSYYPEETLSLAIKLAWEWSSKPDQEPSLRPPRIPSPLQKPPGMVTVRSDAAWSPLGTNARLGWVVLSPAAHRCFQ